MRAAVIVFPGSNCDRDLAVALEKSCDRRPQMIWHKDTALPARLDMVAIPGGFSFGDYLRCGAIAARSPIMRSVVDFARGGGVVLGICNGFQVLLETGLLPGALMRNNGLKFVCKDIELMIETTDGAFLSSYSKGQIVRLPIAHHDGNYIVDDDTVSRLRGEDRIALRYVDNPNGSTADIAGVLSQNRRVLGMMPHPERRCDPKLGGTDGTGLFTSLAQSLQYA